MNKNTKKHKRCQEKSLTVANTQLDRMSHHSDIWAEMFIFEDIWAEMEEDLLLGPKLFDDRYYGGTYDTNKGQES